MSNLQDNIYKSLQKKGLSDKFERAGIYCILLDNKVVYIGKSVNMLKRMAQHYASMNSPKEHKYEVLKEASRRGHNIRFDVMYYAKSTAMPAVIEEIGEEEGNYIRKYKPPLNHQIPKAQNWKEFTVNAEALTVKLSDLLERDNGS